MDSNLRRCPFCGGRPRVERWKEFTRTFVVDADGNEIPEEYERLLIQCCGIQCESEETWNTRAADAVVRELMDALPDSRSYPNTYAWDELMDAEQSMVKAARSKANEFLGYK